MKALEILRNLQAIIKTHPVVSAAAVLAAGLFLLFVWIEVKAELVSVKNEAPVYDLAIVQLREQQEREENVLNTYRLIDAERGIVQIPIERAMQLIVEESHALPK